MITNDVQYRTAKAQVDRLQRLRAELDERPLDTNDGELRRKLETHAVESQASELRAELEEYDALRAGHAPVGHLTTLEDLPRLLVRARIAAGISQKALAERMGLKEQQIQRYESSDYSSASLSRLREVANALDFSVPLPDEVPTSDGARHATLWVSASTVPLSGSGSPRPRLREARRGDREPRPSSTLRRESAGSSAWMPVRCLPGHRSRWTTGFWQLPASRFPREPRRSVWLRTRCTPTTSRSWLSRHPRVCLVVYVPSTWASFRRSGTRRIRPALSRGWCGSSWPRYSGGAFGGRRDVPRCGVACARP